MAFTVMRSLPCLAVAAAISVAFGAGAGCGDNARQCGIGTEDIDGICSPTSSTVCGDGTKLSNGLCVIDPATCEAGTVLVGGRCVDPTRGLTVDLEESFEPNGLGVATGAEASTTPAGTIAPRPIDASFIVHGHLTPFRDADADGQLDPDVDSYQLTVAAPTLLEITVDGVGGAQGAFYLVGDPAGEVPTYERYGLNLTGDTTRRQLFLPAPGDYTFAITDTRALAIGNNPPPPAGATGAAGGPDAEYYASITARTIPAPTMIPAGAGADSLTGTLAADQVAVFTATFGIATNRVRAVMPGAAAASIAVIHAGALDGYASEDAQPVRIAEVVVSGVGATDTPLIVVDAAYNYGPASEPFTVSVEQP
jgi:hypothetical protein